MSRKMFPCGDRDGHDKRLGVTSFVLRIGFVLAGISLLRQSILCHDRVWSRPGVSMSRHSISLSRQSLALGRDFMLGQSIFMSRQSLVKARSFYVATEYFCVATEFGLG